MKNPYVGTIVLRKRHTYINDRTHGPFTFGHLKLAPLELTRILWVVSSFHVKPGQQRFLQTTKPTYTFSLPLLASRFVRVNHLARTAGTSAVLVLFSLLALLASCHSF